MYNSNLLCKVWNSYHKNIYYQVVTRYLFVKLISAKFNFPSWNIPSFSSNNNVLNFWLSRSLDFQLYLQITPRSSVGTTYFEVWTLQHLNDENYPTTPFVKSSSLASPSFDTSFSSYSTSSSSSSSSFPSSQTKQVFIAFKVKVWLQQNYFSNFLS